MRARDLQKSGKQVSGLVLFIATLLLGGDPGSVLGQFTGVPSPQLGATAMRPRSDRTV